MAAKHCNTCGQDRPESEFARHRGALQSKCKPCNRLYQQEHYRQNKVAYITKAAVWSAARRDENTRKILAYFDRHPCVDCGETDPVVLQFDHVRGTKLTEVNRMLGNGTAWTVIVHEIAKCEVRCANCHWRRHAKQVGWRKVLLAAEARFAADE